MGLTRSERVEDLRDLYGAAFVWVESPAEMLARMTAAQRRRFELLMGRGEPSPCLDPALGDASLEPCVAVALATRNLMRRVLEET